MWTFCVCTRTLVQYTSSPCVYKCDNDEIVLVLHPLFNISSSPFNYSLNRSGTAFTAARMVSWGICDHSFSKDLLRESTLLWDLAQALVSRMDHSEKSIGFKSGLDGGHSTLEIKSGILVLRQDWVVLAVCTGAPSCWKRNNSFLNMIWLRSFTTGFKINSL